MHRTIVGVGAVVIGAGLSACGAGARDEAPASQLAVDTVAGVERWVFPGQEAPALDWSADTVTVVGGALVDDDAYQFDRVDGDGLASDAAGRLYLLDRAGSRVLIFDSLGTHLATRGRAGGGPGELGQPLSLAVGPGDSTWVADFGNNRYTVFPPDDGEARSVPFPEETGLPYGHLAIRNDDLIQVLRPLDMRRLAARGPAGPPPEPPRPILHLSALGEITDTLWVSEPPQYNEAQTGDAMGGGPRIMIRMSRAFEPPLAWRPFSDGGIVVSDTAEYTLYLIDPDGTVRRRVDRDLPARPTTEADQEIARERLREQMSQASGVRIKLGGSGGPGAAAPSMEQIIDAQLEAMTFAPVIPRITGLRVDRKDRIWVGVSLDEPGTTQRIDIYDRDGNLLGQLTGWELPDVFLGPSLAASLARDDLEVQQLVIYHIQENAAN